jgi:hypothetical protein
VLPTIRASGNYRLTRNLVGGSPISRVGEKVQALFVIGWRPMTVEQIIEVLIQKRDRIAKAIQALGGRHTTTRSRGSGGSGGEQLQKKRHISAATRKKMAKAHKNHWAALNGEK